MAKGDYLRPDFIVALLAVVIGLSTMFVYIYQAQIMSKQMHVAAWPYLEAVYSVKSKSFSIRVYNKGVGPAIVKDAYLTLDNARYEDSRQSLDSLTFQLTGIPRVVDDYTSLNGRVMASGEVIPFIEMSDSVKVAKLLYALREHTVQLSICYCSVFDECWTVRGSKVESCDDCE